MNNSHFKFFNNDLLQRWLEVPVPPAIEICLINSYFSLGASENCQ